MSKQQQQQHGRVLRPASFESPLHLGDQGKGVKPMHPSTTDPKYTPSSFQAPALQNGGQELVQPEDAATRDQAYALGPIPDDIESREFGEMYGSIRRSKKQHEEELREERETSEPQHDIDSLVDKEDKAIVHDLLFRADTADGLPYVE